MRGIASGTKNGSPQARRGAVIAWEDHSQRNEKQDDTAGDTDRLFLKTQQSQQIFTEKQEHQQHQ